MEQSQTQPASNIIGSDTKKVNDTAKLNNKLQMQLKVFEKIKEWPDIQNWLTKIAQILRDHPSPYIGERILFAKRLAQCLNPALPYPVLVQALDCYELIFKNMKQMFQTDKDETRSHQEYIQLMAEDLSIYSVGLFPFFQNAVSQIKPRILDIFINYYAPLGMQLIPCIAGLVAAILPGLDDQNEEIQRQVIKLLDLAKKGIGKKYLFGACWMVMLRSSKAKLSSLKYVSMRIPKVKNPEIIEEEASSDYEAALQSDDDEQDDQDDKDIISVDVDDDDDKDKKSKKDKKKKTTKQQSKQNDKSNKKSKIAKNKNDEEEKQKKKKKKTTDSDEEASKNNSDSDDKILDEDVQQKPIENKEKSEKSTIESEKKKTEPPAQKRKMAKSQDLKQPQLKELEKTINQVKSVSQNTNANQLNNNTNDDDVQTEQIDRTRKDRNQAEIARLKETCDEDTFETYYPNLSVLVVNAIISCLDLQNATLVQKTAMDFLLSHMPLDSDFLSKSDKLNLIQAVLHLFTNQELSLCRRVNTWFFGKPDMDNVYNITADNQENLNYVIEAFLLMLKQKPANLDEAVSPLKILQIFYMEHQHLVQCTLYSLSQQIVHYIFFYSQEDNCSFHAQFFKQGYRFMENIQSHLGVILIKLSDELYEAIKGKVETEKCIALVELADFCFSKLVIHKQEESEFQIQRAFMKSIIFGMLRAFTQFDRADDELKLGFEVRAMALILKILEALFELVERRIKKNMLLQQSKFGVGGGGLLNQSQISVIQISANLQMSTINNGYTSGDEDLLFAQQQSKRQSVVSANKDQNDTQILQDATIETQMTQVQFQQGCIDHFQKFYDKIVSFILKTNNRQSMLQEQSPHLHLLSLSSKALVRLQVFVDHYVNILPVEEIQSQNNQQEQTLPCWFYSMARCLKSSNPNISILVCEAIIFIIKHATLDPTYAQLKKLIENTKFPRKSHDPNSNKDEEEETNAEGESSTTIYNEYDLSKVAFIRLWDMLDYKRFQEKITRFLIQTQEQFPLIFSEVVLASFKTSNITEKDLAIKRFGIFWKILAEVQKQHKHTINIHPAGIFKMLDFLEHDNPLIRHSSKTWLLDSYPFFYRIIDPLFEVLLSGDTHCYETDQQQYFYTKQYNTTTTIQAFRNLQSILVIGGELFIRYISMVEMSRHICNVKAKFPEQQNSKRYIDLVVIISLKFIQGQAMESFSTTFYRNNQSVQAAASEFLEALLIRLENKSLCQSVITNITDPLLLTLSHAIENQEFVLEVQLLNLLKVILDNMAALAQSKQKFAEKTQQDRQADLTKFLQHRLFLINILNGIKTDKTYVREQFIGFLNMCTFFFGTHLNHKNLTQCIKSILENYYKIIRTTLERHHIRVESAATLKSQSSQDSNYPVPQNQINENESANANALEIGDQTPSQEATSQQQIQQLVQQQEQQLQSTRKQQKSQQGENDVIDFIQDKGEATSTFKQEYDVVSAADSLEANLQTSSLNSELEPLLEAVKSTITYIFEFKQSTTDTEAQAWHYYTERQDTITTEIGGFFKTVLTLGLLSNKDPERLRREANLSGKFYNSKMQLLSDLDKLVAMYILCFQESHVFDKQFDFSTIGTHPYSFEKYSVFNKEILYNYLNINNQKVVKHSKTVKTKILHVMKPITSEYTVEVLNAFLAVWTNSCITDVNLSSTKDGKILADKLMNQQMELLLNLNVPPEVFIQSLNKCNQIKTVNSYYTSKSTKERMREPMNFDIAVMESRILFFVYTYTSNVYVDITALSKEYLHNLWTTILFFMKTFSLTQNPNSLLWMMECIVMLSKKYSPKEIISDSKMKSDLHAFINTMLERAASIACGLTEINFAGEKPPPNKPAAQPDTQKVAKEDLKYMNRPYNVVLPLPPTIYEVYSDHYMNMHIEHRTEKKHQSDGGGWSRDAHNALNSKIFTLLRIKEFLTPSQQTSPTKVTKEDNVQEKEKENKSNANQTYIQKLQKTYRLFCFKTLKNMSLEILLNTYSPEKTEFVSKRVKNYMEPIFELLICKSVSNEEYVECASETVYMLLFKARQFLLKDFKKSILEIFNGNDFFKCSKQTLFYWSKIIDWVIAFDKNDLFTEYLSKVNMGLWLSFLNDKNEQKQTKIKNFERICFIIYSGDVDRYEQKLSSLIEKISDIIKSVEPENTTNASLLILNLFCIRILITRLSKPTLLNLFKNIWPMLLTLLLQIFRTSDKKYLTQTNKSPHLLLAGLKLIELISIFEIDEFYLHQWIFVFDYFGLEVVNKLDTNKQSKSMGISKILNVQQADIMSDDMGGGGQDQVNIISIPHDLQMTPFVFQPYIVNILPTYYKINYECKQQKVISQSQQEQLQQKKTEDSLMTFKKNKRSIVITKNFVESNVEIKHKALWLCTYLIQNNEQRSYVDQNEIEQLIQEDFISINENIFKID